MRKEKEMKELAQKRLLQSLTLRKVKSALLGDEGLEERIRLAVVAIAELELKLSIISTPEEFTDAPR